MKKYSYFLLSVIFMMIQHSSFGQVNPDTTKVYRIETKDGNTFTGFIMKEDATVIILETYKLGELTISQTDYWMHPGIKPGLSEFNSFHTFVA